LRKVLVKVTFFNKSRCLPWWAHNGLLQQLVSTAIPKLGLTDLFVLAKWV